MNIKGISQFHKGLHKTQCCMVCELGVVLADSSNSLDCYITYIK